MGLFLWNLWNSQEQWWLLLKICNMLLCNKNYVGHKVAIFNAALFTLLHLLLTWWWGMRLKHDVAWLLCAFIVNSIMRHETQAWCGMTLRGTSRLQKRVPEMKRSIAHAVLHWSELIPLYQRISIIIFKVCFSRICLPSRATKQTFWKFCLRADTLCSPKTIGWVLGYTTFSIYTWNLLVCNSGQYIYVTGLHNFFFVLQDVIERINCYFQRIAFWRNLLFIDF